MGVAKRPDLRKLICKMQRLFGPVHHCGELRIVRCPLIDLSFCELCNVPGCSQVFRAPHTRSVEIATPTRPQQPRGRITDDVIDGPAVAERPLNCPVLPIAFARYQEGTLRRADKYRDPVLTHRHRSPVAGVKEGAHSKDVIPGLVAIKTGNLRPAKWANSQFALRNFSYASAMAICDTTPIGLDCLLASREQTFAAQIGISAKGQ